MTTNTVAVDGKFHLTTASILPITAKRPCDLVKEAINEAIYADLMCRNLHNTEYTVDITGYRAPLWCTSAESNVRNYTVHYTACVTFADPACATFFRLTPE